MKEKERLTHNISIIEEKLNKFKSSDISKTQEIAQLRSKIQQMETDMDLIKENWEKKIKSSIQKIEKPLKTRIAEIESELRMQKRKVLEAQEQSEIVKKNDDILNIMDKLSVMLITKSSDPNFLNPEQQRIIKSLFGDYGIRMNKDKIAKLEQKCK